MPSELLPAFDHVVELIYDGFRPNKNVRLDMCVMCVEAFQWIVALIANSPYCIADFMNENDARKGLYERCDDKRPEMCAVCIRSHAYRELIERTKKRKEEET